MEEYPSTKQGERMSKAHRGKGIRAQVKSGRGVCPICKRSGVKVVYEVNKLLVCKMCRKKALEQGKKAEKETTAQEVPAQPVEQVKAD